MFLEFIWFLFWRQFVLVDRLRTYLTHVLILILFFEVTVTSYVMECFSFITPSRFAYFLPLQNKLFWGRFIMHLQSIIEPQITLFYS